MEPSIWRHLGNTVERSVRDGDVALCRITLTADLFIAVSLTGDNKSLKRGASRIQYCVYV